MRIDPTEIDGVAVIASEPVDDERGSFTRLFDVEEFARRGLATGIVQSSLSFNHRAGTLRGLHYQRAPHAERKIVRCLRGELFDVAVDLRPDSSTYLRWFGLHLSGENRLALHVPQGCAHGFLTLADATEVLYEIDAPHVPSHAAGVRWDDPSFGIHWPRKPTVMAERDGAYPDLVP